MRSMLTAFRAAYDAMNPDVVLTEGGDQRWFPWLVEQGTLHDQPMVLGRTSAPLQQTTNQRTVHSYGQTRHRHGAFFLDGRLHIDLKNSFIVSEGASPVCLNCSTLATISPNHFTTLSGFGDQRHSNAWPWMTGCLCRGRKPPRRHEIGTGFASSRSREASTLTVDRAFMHRSLNSILQACSQASLQHATSRRRP